MYRYDNLGGNSSIIAYKIYPDKIDVQFKGGKIYTYSYNVAGSSKVNKMKELAQRGIGLCSFINRNARFDYDK